MLNESPLNAQNTDFDVSSRHLQQNQVCWIQVSPSHFPPTLYLDLIANSLRPFLACLEISPRYTKNIKQNHLNLSRHQVDQKRPFHTTVANCVKLRRINLCSEIIYAGSGHTLRHFTYGHARAECLYWSSVDVWLDALYCEFILWEDCNLLIDSMRCMYANNFNSDFHKFAGCDIQRCNLARRGSCRQQSARQTVVSNVLALCEWQIVQCMHGR